MTEQTHCTHEHDTDHRVEARAQVLRIEGEWAIVQIDSQGCGRCHEPGGCGGNSLTDMLSPSKTYRLPNTIGAQVGDRVRIEGPANVVSDAALRAYVVPLLLCIAGAALGQWLGQNAGAMLGGALGLFLGWLQLRWAGVRNTAPEAVLHMRHETS